MSFDLTWIKTTALSAVQHAAAVVLAGDIGQQTNLFAVNWASVGGVAGLTALVSVLAAVVAYKAPSAAVTAAISAPTAAVQAARLVADSDEARKT
jgi:hypothetical protein